MIRLLLLFGLLTNANSTEVRLGGVDVGNGRVIGFEFEMSELFNTEQELLDYVDINKKKIQNGTYTDVASLIKELNCSNQLKFKHLEIKESYPFENGQLLKKKFNGHMKIELNNCKPGL